MKRFEKKVAIVTGAAQGIGRGIAECLAREGASVVVNDLEGSEAAAVASDIERENFPSKALVCVADVSKPAEVNKLFSEALDRFQQLDIVVANAAFSIRAPVVEAKWDDVLRTIEVTQFGVYHVCQAAARQMVEQAKGGKIVIIGSVLSEIPFPTSSAYCMAKAAITHFARTLAEELAPHRINVNVVSPGYIDTPGARKFASNEEMAKAGNTLPWGRLGTPSDIAKAVAFLASEDADYITGSVLVVDGGLRGGMRF
jgi:glucose 1-dehydrogenase